MELLWWGLIVFLFVLSFAGIVYPIIPTIPVLWGAFAIYHFFINSAELSLFFWIAMVVLSVILIAADIIANSYFVKRYGGSKLSERIAAIATIVGSFIFPPFGLLLVPFAAVMLTEYLIHKELGKSVKVGLATVIGFLGGSIAKILIQLIMIVWFILSAIF